MKTYLDIDEILRHRHRCFEQEYDEFHLVSAVPEEVILSLPPADVVEVRHGRWIADKEDVEWGNYLIRYRCSECNERPHFDKDKYKFILSSYCPNCGAKMDGGNNNASNT